MRAAITNLFAKFSNNGILNAFWESNGYQTTSHKDENDNSLCSNVTCTSVWLSFPE